MPQNGIISHIITYDIIYHENPDLSTSFSIFLPFFYLFRHLSETVRRKRRFLCILRGVRRDIYPARVQTFRSRTENRMSGLSDHRKSRFKYSRQTKQKARSLSRQRTNSTMPAPKLEYPVSATPTHMLRICVNSRFFFCRSRRKRKSYQKENAGMRFRALRSATVAADGSRRLLKKAGENFIKSARNFIGARYEKKRNPCGFPFFVFTYCRGRYAPRGDLLSYRKRRHFFRPPARRYQPFSCSAPHRGHASA